MGILFTTSQWQKFRIISIKMCTFLEQTGIQHSIQVIYLESTQPLDSGDAPVAVVAVQQMTSVRLNCSQVAYVCAAASNDQNHAADSSVYVADGAFAAAVVAATAAVGTAKL